MTSAPPLKRDRGDFEPILDLSAFLYSHMLVQNVDVVEDQTLAALGEAIWPLQTKVIRELLRRFKERDEKLRSLLTMLAKIGALRIIDRLSNMLPDDVECERLPMFQIACKNRKLALAQWLHNKYKYTVDEVRMDENSLFRELCELGCLDVAKWLVSEFGLTADDARAENNHAFRLACANGHLAVAQWLFYEIGLTKEDASVYENDAFSNACRIGNLPMAKWLTSILDLVSILGTQRSAKRRIIFISICRSGKLQVAEWYAETFHITRDDIRSMNSFTAACADGYLDLAQWLYERFDLTVADVVVQGNSPIRWAFIKGHYHIVRWLCNKFGIRSVDI